MKQIYAHDSEWKYNELSERIGYVKEDNYLPSMFYAPFKHGIYSLKDDPENLFYQPKSFCKQGLCVVCKG